MRKVILFLCCLAGLTGCGRKSIELTRGGEPKAVIVIKDGASSGVQFAAKELQKYVAKVSGAQLPIQTESSKPSGTLVLVGNDAADLGSEGFRLKSAGGNLLIQGKDDAGTQYGVYDFLERVAGVRWLWPGELGEVIPKAGTIGLDEIAVAEEPSFKWRNRGPGGALWGATTGPTEMRTRERLLGVSAEHQAEVALWEKRNRWGGLNIYGGHSLGEAFPPEKYAKTHPEYYALVNGARAVPGKDYDYKHGGQVCTTNPGVVKATVEWVRSMYNEHPDYDGIHITMNDGSGFCECSRCRALDSNKLLKRPGIEVQEMQKNPARYTIISDRIFTFVNQVAEEVEKTHPGKYVASMAYARYSIPPDKVVLRPNVMVQYCLWSAYRHPSPELKKEHEEIAAGWAKAAKRSGVYEYYINGSWPGMHRLFAPHLANSIRFLHKQGMDLYQTQSGDDFAINGLNYFVAGRLLWDASLDDRSIVADFYDKGFGKAAPKIRAFHIRLQEAWKSAVQDRVDVTCDSIEKTRLLEYFTPELLAACVRELREAEAAADDELVRRRVNFYREGLRYTELVVDAVRASRGALAAKDPAERRKLAAEALAAWEKRDRFVEEHKNDFVVAYFWVKYNDLQRNFNPTARLREIVAQR